MFIEFDDDESNSNNNNNNNPEHKKTHRTERCVTTINVKHAVHSFYHDNILGSLYLIMVGLYLYTHSRVHKCN